MYSSERTSSEYLLLNSCGIQYLSKSDLGSSRINGRVDYHIVYVERGVCHIKLDGEETEAEAGNIILFRPGEPQEYCFFAGDNSISHYVHFTGSGCETLLKKLGIYDVRIFNMGRDEGYEKLSSRLLREFSLKNGMWEITCAGILAEMLGVIGRKHALRSSSVSKKSENRINTACRRIYENIDKNLTVSLLAEECFISESRFTHLFREVTGKSPKEYIAEIKINIAKEMLSEGNYSVRNISESLGFLNQNYFSRVFRKHTGISPSEYRRKYK